MPRTKQFDENQVLEKAVDLFWKQGYHATSMQDLVDHLGINRASLYATFGDKKRLFVRAINHYRAINAVGMSDFLQSESDVRTGMRKLLEKAILEAHEDIDRKGCFVVNTTTELVPGDAEIEQLVEENKTDFEERIYSYLKRGQTEGQLPSSKDVKAIANLIFTLYNGIRVVGKMSPTSETLTTTVDTALSLLD